MENSDYTNYNKLPNCSLKNAMMFHVLIPWSGIHYGLALPNSPSELLAVGAQWLSRAFWQAKTLPKDGATRRILSFHDIIYVRIRVYILLHIHILLYIYILLCIYCYIYIYIYGYMYVCIYIYYCYVCIVIYILLYVYRYTYCYIFFIIWIFLVSHIILRYGSKICQTPRSCVVLGVQKPNVSYSIIAPLQANHPGIYHIFLVSNAKWTKQCYFTQFLVSKKTCSGPAKHARKTYRKCRRFLPLPVFNADKQETCCFVRNGPVIRKNNET